MNPRLFVVGLAAILLAAVVWTGAGGAAASALAAILLVFVLPGYALTKLLFPRGDLELAESVALALGLSLAVSAMGGLVLYLLPWRLETRSWTALLASITLLATLGALWRHPHLGSIPRSFASVRISFSPGEVLLFVLAGAVVAGAYGLAYQGERAQNNTDFTQLWIRPDEEDASAVVVGINNHATEAVRYRLEIKQGQAVVGALSPIELKPEESWAHSFSMPKGSYVVTAELFRLYAPGDPCYGVNRPDICQQNDEVYREVLLRR